ncbi:1,2-phenylacetyl-CoA epoxidase subunit PaaA [Tumebacillus permanentifrigoris]|uniref:Ring-1,2-phenylacetyl-CoA epoxidase subunit PaaA n=1 Tax=Tumebacillus permanentifrigoris TaxID=378543 RepID=A0A316D4C1_9BACL|nr:1,2-phenylacetyl-CoA epoxidase subunit PaaA [Tumebacillus permanentifrigoris]PWK07420.1 ring-1,2-phenylacetyl-CoA epoxidase subunit PaaA [Tumebacillus permanentifrigoris]
MIAQTYEEKRAAFLDKIEHGGKIEADDWMPDDYRQQLIKLISMHGMSEIMGALPEKEWVPKAPTLRRKLAIMAKVQDEMGHGQLLLRVAEDLLAPLGKNREDLLEDLFTGRLKFHNVFHMEAPTWADAGVIGWLVDGAAIITQTMSLDTSYAPYARALYRICAEEKFHAQHGESIVLALAEGTPEQRAMLQESVTRWWPALLMFFGPPEDGKISSNQQQNMAYKIRSQTNEELRQAFFDKYVQRIFHLGLTLPDPTIRYDKTEGKWHYQQPDWNEFKQIVTGHGPCSVSRLDLRKLSYQQAQWVRDALLNNTQQAI